MKEYRNRNGCWPRSFDIAWSWIDPVDPCTLITPQPCTPYRSGATLMPERHCFAQVTKGFLIGIPSGHMLAFIFVRQPLALPFSNFPLPWTWLSYLPEKSLSSTLVCRAPCLTAFLVPGFHLCSSPLGISPPLASAPPPGLTFHPLPIPAEWTSETWSSPCPKPDNNSLSLRSALLGLLALCFSPRSPSGPFGLFCHTQPESPVLLPPDRLVFLPVFHSRVWSSLFSATGKWGQMPESSPWFFPHLLGFLLLSIGNQFSGQAPTKNTTSDSLLFTN